MLDNSILFLNAKGGCLKTSISAHTAGLAARDGWRVLLIDLDRQGNTADDLGFRDRSDLGKALADAVVNNTIPEPLKDVRPNLDVLCGGTYTDQLSNWISLQASQGNVSAYYCLANVLAPLRDSYDLIVFDCPPGHAALHAATLTAGHYVLVPTQPDVSSVSGLEHVFRQWVEVRKATNPEIEILGVVLAPVDSRATTRKREVRNRLTDLLGEEIPLFEATVRLAQTTAGLGRDLGMLSYELADEGRNQEPWYKRRDEQNGHTAISRTAQGLAEDYRDLVAEILAAFVNKHTEWMAVPA